MRKVIQMSQRQISGNGEEKSMSLQDARCRPLHDLEITRPCRCQDDAGVCQNHQPEKG